MPQSPHRLRNNLKCVEWDVKHCSIKFNVLLLANVHSFADWLIVFCCRQQPTQENGDSSVMRIPPSTEYDTIGAPQPDVVYGEVQRAPRVNNPHANDLYANVPSKKQYEDPGTVIYSELQRRN